jgi:ribosomal protein S25
VTRARVLTREQIKAIRAEYEFNVVSYATLARKYGVGESTIRDCVKLVTA